MADWGWLIIKRTNSSLLLWVVYWPERRRGPVYGISSTYYIQASMSLSPCAMHLQRATPPDEHECGTPLAGRLWDVGCDFLSRRGVLDKRIWDQKTKENGQGGGFPDIRPRFPETLDRIRAKTDTRRRQGRSPKPRRDPRAPCTAAAVHGQGSNSHHDFRVTARS